MRRSDRIAFAIAWPVFFVTVFLAFRKITSVPGGDVNALVIVTALGALGLILIAIWLQERD